MRTSGVADIREVERAILELNGQLTIVKRGDTSIKFPLVLDGQIAFDTLEDIHKDEDWLRRELAEQGYEPENVYMANYLDDRVVVAAYARGRSLPKK